MELTCLRTDVAKKSGTPCLLSALSEDPLPVMLVSMNGQKIVVVGGGTAGFLAAVFCKTTDPLSSVHLVTSEEIPPIGVGEGSTPVLLSFLDSIGITLDDLVKEADATIKNGIYFNNWNGVGTSYFNPFVETLIDFAVENVFVNGCYDEYLKNAINTGRPLDLYSYSRALSNQNKVDLENNGISVHFDASKMANFLAKKSKTLGVQTVSAKYVDSEFDLNGFIESVILENGQKLECDFVIDASGLQRQIIGKTLQQRWISFSESLPMKKAIPFWLDSEEETKPYTTATALEYGWMWQIPTQLRIGSGYVFDSDFIDATQAKEEVEKTLGRNIEVRKEIDFSPGMFENVWVKNCVAVGLASSFVEPLEATSISVTCEQLMRLRFSFANLKIAHQSVVDSFNSSFRSTMNEIAAFLYMHYMTKRKSSIFWKNFQDNNKMPEFLEEKIDSIRAGQIFWFSTKDQLAFMNFDQLTTLFVAEGLDLIEKPIPAFRNIRPTLRDAEILIARATNHAAKHDVVLQNIKSKLK